VGKSDSIIFPWYAERMQHLRGKRIAFLGQTGHNFLSLALAPSSASFYDASLQNWDINQEGEWSLADVDAIVCTRCAYFSEKPEQFIARCLDAVPNGGSVIIDWGLGDHWRHSTFMVGWERGEERVSAKYATNHYLRSTFWRDEFLTHPEVKKFSAWIREKGYKEPLSKIISEEVPRIASHPTPFSYDAVTLWRNDPQLYILTEFRRD